MLQSGKLDATEAREHQSLNLQVAPLINGQHKHAYNNPLPLIDPANLIWEQ